ncbi:hypothetical protein B0H11DRAFT_2214410 [Mycena galericulata]|nr:hypothetical protein B0H11DRAFT_2214410 [Mycena galericulata]
MPRPQPHLFFQVNFLCLSAGVKTVYRGLYIVGINSLLFASYAAARRVVSTFPQLSLPETGLAGSMAGAVLASPGASSSPWAVRRRLQSAPAHRRRETWAQWGFRKGIMHGYRVIVALGIPTYAGLYRVRILQALVWCSVPRRTAPSVDPAGERLDGRAYAFMFVSYVQITYQLACYALDVMKSIAHPPPLHAPDAQPTPAPVPRIPTPFRHFPEHLPGTSRAPTPACTTHARPASSTSASDAASIPHILRYGGGSKQTRIVPRLGSCMSVARDASVEPDAWPGRFRVIGVLVSTHTPTVPRKPAASAVSPPPPSLAAAT